MMHLLLDNKKLNLNLQKIVFDTQTQSILDNPRTLVTDAFSQSVDTTL